MKVEKTLYSVKQVEPIQKIYIFNFFVESKHHLAQSSCKLELKQVNPKTSTLSFFHEMDRSGMNGKIRLC
jgi:hypothetical protein